MRAFWLIGLLLAWGCDPADEEDPPDAGGSSGLAKGEMCGADGDCMPGAICRQGNLCTGVLTAEAFQTECGMGGAELCPGLACIGLVENRQGKTGVCTMPCANNADCAGAGVCAALSGRMLCVRDCTTSDDCLNGFVCIDNPEGAGRACLAEPL